MTVSIDNFIKTIYKQSSQLESDTKLSTIAAILKITNAAATDMARKLAQKGLLNYTKYKPVTLTDSGFKHALKVVRKHRLWETFLHEILNLSLHEIHEEAEHLEHLTSDFLADRIEKFLGSPNVDPHGDPIPNKKGIIIDDDSELLSTAKAGNNYKVSRLSSSDRDFFEFCESHNIMIGTDIWVEKQLESNKMTEIRVNQNSILLNELFTNDIFVTQTLNI